MSEFAVAREESELEALETGEGVQSFDIGLFEEGDEESGFHTKNDPQDPFHRSKVVQRKGAVDVKCSCIDIVHGRWGSDEPTAKASLIVLLFRFDPRKRARRIISAHIEFKFFDAAGQHRKNPEVVDISLNDSYSLVPTQRSESFTTGSEVSVGAGAFGAELGGRLMWEKTIDQETSDATHVVGSIDRLDAAFGPNNAASWTLTENGTLNTGVPAAMTVGILLKRETDNDFYCTVKLATEVDFKTAVGQLFGGREPDHPIHFRTSAAAPTNKKRKYAVDPENLGSFSISAVEDVTFTTMRNGVIKGKAD